MNNSETSRHLSEIREMLEKGNIKKTLRELEKHFSETGAWKHRDEAQRVGRDYQFLLDFFRTGNSDPTREFQYNKIQNRTLALIETARRRERIENGTDLFSAKARFEKLQNLELLPLLTKCETGMRLSAPGVLADLNRLFYRLWTLDYLSKGECKKIDSMLKDETLPYPMRATLVDALIFSGLEYLDMENILWIVDICEATLSERLAARATVGLLLILMRHKDALAGNFTLRHRLALWEENLITFTRLRSAVQALIRTRETDKISQKLNNDVIPEIMKMRPEIMKRMKEMNPEELQGAMMEENPEWEEMLGKSKLRDKLQELSEMQTEGADVMMVAFSNLKQFPFFNELPNWLLPFYDDNEEVVRTVGDGNDRSLLGILTDNSMICDSDKYSLALSLRQVPEAQRNMLAGQLEAQMQQIREELKSRQLKSGTPEFDIEANNYVRGLYRLFRLFRKKEDLTDPFEKPFDFFTLPVIGGILSDDEILQLIGEFYFKRGYHEEAIPILERMLEKNPSDFQVIEKLGFSHQKSGRVEKALECYKKAELLGDESVWLIKKLALCNKMTGNFSKAADYYRRALEKQPDNLTLTLGLGSCLSALDNPKEALRHFYKADYLDKGRMDVMRAIAWNEMLAGNSGKSIEYHERVIAAEPTPTDFMNAAHARLLAGETEEAVKLYRRSLKEFGDDKRFLETFAEDIPTLERLGLTRLDLTLLRENLSD